MTAQAEALAALIRKVDGRHDLSATALAERLVGEGVTVQQRPAPDRAKRLEALQALREGQPEGMLEAWLDRQMQVEVTGRGAYLLSCVHEEAKRGLSDTLNPHASLRRIKILSDPEMGDYLPPAEAPAGRDG